MTRTISVIALTICALMIATAQEIPKPPAKAEPKPDIVRLEAPSQQEIAEAQRVANEARAVFETASARYEAAQQKVVTSIYKAMADVGCPPKQCQVKQSQQDGIYFERTKPAETAATAPGKPAPSAISSPTAAKP